MKLLISHKNYEDLLKLLNSIRPNIDFSTEKDLWENAIFDSFELMQLIVMIEEMFDFHFNEDTLVPETFFSAKTIWNVIKVALDAD